MVIFALAILILAIIVIRGSSILIEKQGLPQGKLIYTDTHQWQSIVKPLFDRELGLTGKPDYIIRNGREIIPVEIKSFRGNSTPLDSHVFQLAAYCYLIHKEFDQRPPYGIIHYTPGNEKYNSSASQTYAIDYSKKLETRLLNTIEQMQSIDTSLPPSRSHQTAWRCKRCGYRSNCDQRL